MASFSTPEDLHGFLFDSSGFTWLLFLMASFWTPADLHGFFFIPRCRVVVVQLGLLCTKGVKCKKTNYFIRPHWAKRRCHNVLSVTSCRS